MQPILMLAIVGVAAVALGTGFLNNNIELWIQQFGVGSGDIETPVDHVTVDFNIEQRSVIPPTTPATYKNIIDKCEFTITEDVGVANNGEDSMMTCKITGHDENWLANGEIIAEGTICRDIFTAAIGTYAIPLGENECGTNLGPLTVDVRAAGDVIVVVQADSYSAGEHTCTPPQVLDRTTNTCVDI